MTNPKWANYTAFRNWLLTAMAERGWKPVDLARRVTPDQPASFASTISKWLHGHRQPDPESCAILAETLGADLDYVLTLAGHRPTYTDDPVISGVVAMLQDLPREQVEMIHTMTMALHGAVTKEGV